MDRAVPSTRWLCSLLVTGCTGGPLPPGDARVIPAIPMVCLDPGAPVDNGMGCGNERWDIKTGTDAEASGISLIPQGSSVHVLIGLPPPDSVVARVEPTETTVWQLTNVTLTELKEEADSDYHLVLSDGIKTMIAEIPFPSCAPASAWSCFISRARSQIDAAYTVTPTPVYPAATMTVRGVGFFDFLHDQNGVAPNAIELHPLLELCFGQDCEPG